MASSSAVRSVKARLMATRSDLVANRCDQRSDKYGERERPSRISPAANSGDTARPDIVMLRDSLLVAFAFERNISGLS
jgi:hypothetical protein